jgi:hypothetical protein
MKIKTKVALVIGVATLAVTPAFAKGGQGTDITHVAYRVAMTNDGVEPSAAGTISVSANVQGNANKQQVNAQRWQCDNGGPGGFHRGQQGTRHLEPQQFR